MDSTGMDQKEVAEIIGISESYLSNIMNNKRPISRKMALKLKEAFKRIDQKDAPMGVPVYQQATTGQSGQSLIKHLEILKPDFLITIPWYNGSDWALMYVGQSMYPKYKSGDVIPVKKLRGLDDLIYGNTYLIVTKPNHLRAVRYVFKGKDDDHLLLSPDNPDYQEQQIHRDNIAEMYVILGSLGRDM